MKGAWPVCKREFASYFTTPVGYVVIAVFALISGLGFSASFIAHARITAQPSMFAYTEVPDFEENFLSPFLVFCGMLIMFIGPLATMGLLAKEKNRGTIELLLTHPLRDSEIIFGKFAAALGMLVLMLGVIGVHLGIVNYFVAVEPAVLVFGLIAVFLMGAAFISLGLFISAVCRNQVTAGTATFGAWFVSYILGSFAEDMPKQLQIQGDVGEGLRNIITSAYGVFRAFIMELPLDFHAKEMAEGIFQPKDVVYYLLVITFFLFLTFRALETRKWRA